jgi:hypothetical protein
MEGVETDNAGLVSTPLSFEPAQFYLGQFALGILGKIAVHHPVVIRGLFFQHGGDLLVFVLAEIEYLFAAFVLDHSACEVYHISGNQVAKHFHVISDFAYFSS